MARDTTLASFHLCQQDLSMSKTNASMTTSYPVLFSAGTAGVPKGEAELVLALLVTGSLRPKTPPVDTW
jgi:hypothetical protein